MTALFGVDHPAPYDPDDLDDPHNQHAALLARRSKDGAKFILDAPEEIPAIWGHGQDVLWARGESLLIAGPPGVGKTTLASQVIRARLGIGGDVLGQPIEKGVKRVLYLAMDRPAQIARALRRSFTEHDRAVLHEQLVVWSGPPPTDLAKHPEELVGLATTFGADTVIIDSLKDAFLGLSNDEEAAGYNRARQYALAEGVELIELHHQVKRGAAGGKPNTLADVYGSAWITAGAGSVILLYGEAGDPIVDFRHLKQPANEVGPYRLIHDHTTGTTEIFHSTDLLQLATASRGGVSTRAAAEAIFETDKPTENQMEKARYRLDVLDKQGQLEKIPSVVNGKAGYVYIRATGVSGLLTPDNPRIRAQHAPQKESGVVSTPHTPDTPQENGIPAGQDPRLDPRHPRTQAPQDSTPPFIGGGTGPEGADVPSVNWALAAYLGDNEDDRIPEPPSLPGLTSSQLDQIAGTPCQNCGARAGHEPDCPDDVKENGGW